MPQETCSSTGGSLRHALLVLADLLTTTRVTAACTVCSSQNHSGSSRQNCTGHKRPAAAMVGVPGTSLLFCEVTPVTSTGAVCSQGRQAGGRRPSCTCHCRIAAVAAVTSITTRCSPLPNETVASAHAPCEDCLCAVQPRETNKKQKANTHATRDLHHKPESEAQA